MAKKKAVKSYPSGNGRTTPIPNWKPPPLGRSSDSIACTSCQESNLFWSWNYAKNKPHLVNEYNAVHRCKTPNKQDVFPGWCEKCHAPELLWLRRQDGFELTESYALPHACEVDPLKAIQDMSAGKCRGCKATDLFWIQVEGKFSLVHQTGAKHVCPAYDQYNKDWAEAKRMNYAIEKAWIDSHPDGFKCKKCKGENHTIFYSKSKKKMQMYNSSEPIMMHRPCLRCKRLGTFTVANKKFYLKSLRKSYWPFKGGTHKWKKYDTGL